MQFQKAQKMQLSQGNTLFSKARSENNKKKTLVNCSGNVVDVDGLN